MTMRAWVFVTKLRTYFLVAAVFVLLCLLAWTLNNTVTSINKVLDLISLRACVFIVHNFIVTWCKTMKNIDVLEGFQAAHIEWLLRLKWCEAWTSITIPYVNNLCLSTIRRLNEHKNDLHLKCFVIDYLHISYMSWMCYNNNGICS